MLAISIPCDTLCLHKKMRKTTMVEPFSWLWWLNVELLFIAFMTGRMFRPRISLKIGRFGPGFQWSKCRSIFWKEILRIFDQFLLPIFSTRTFSTWELAVLKSAIFLFKHFYSDFYHWNCKSLLRLWIRKGLWTNYRKPHRYWSFRSWEIWIYSCVMRFFHYFFSNLINVSFLFPLQLILNRLSLLCLWALGRLLSGCVNAPDQYEEVASAESILNRLVTPHVARKLLALGDFPAPEPTADLRPLLTHEGGFLTAEKEPGQSLRKLAKLLTTNSATPCLIWDNQCRADLTGLVDEQVNRIVKTVSCIAWLLMRCVCRAIVILLEGSQVGGASFVMVWDRAECCVSLSKAFVNWAVTTSSGILFNLPGSRTEKTTSLLVRWKRWWRD